MSHRPVIGIITNLERDPHYRFPGYPRITQNEDYARSVLAAGGVPLLLVPCDDLTVLDEQLAVLDGLLLTGGPDIDPMLYGQQPHRLCGSTCPTRDRFELAALGLARDMALPTLGICRGAQMINVFAGGTLHQDLSLTPSTQQHLGHANPDEPIHHIDIEPASTLHRIWKTTEARVNSFHHQAIDKLGWQLRVIARSADGIIEAIEWANDDFWLLGVQWHPEMMTRTNDQAQALFGHFVRLCTVADEPSTPRRANQGPRPTPTVV